MSAGAIVKEFNIPRTTLHRWVQTQRVKGYLVSTPLHQRKQWRFKRSEIRAALGLPASDSEPPAP